MSDLIAADVLNESTGNGNGRGNGNGNGSARPGGSGQPSPYSASGVRGPRDVMRDRQAREARKRAESEARQREQQEGERRAQEERRRSVERRAAAAAAGVAGVGDGVGYRRSTGYEAVESGSKKKIAPLNIEKRPVDRAATGGEARPVAAQVSQPTATAPSSVDRTRDPMPDSRNPGTTAATGGGAGAGSRAVSGGSSRLQQAGGASSQPQQRPVPAQQTSTTGHQNRGTTQAPQARPIPSAAAPDASATAPPIPAARSAEATQSRNPNVSSFPHAFERWETLSSHWEGLTSYWIRRLEQNREEVGREPLAQQMSRQITDLSAAGANLFHAVVELQRLRASSERKFQRWFFETRAEQERAQEVQGELETALRWERQQRAEAIQATARLEGENANAEKRVAEMKRELQISKEEARRAWEELGRREQEERERTISLRDGQPTVMGGIQVVPMTPGGVSRHGSVNRPSTREGPYGAETSPVAERYAIRPDERAGTDSGLEDPFIEPGPRSADRYAPSSHGDGFVVADEGQPAVTNGLPSGASRSRVDYPSTSQQASGSSQTSNRAAPYVEGASTGPTTFYQHQGTSIQGPGQIGVPRADNRSVLSHPSEEGTVSEEEYAYDEHGDYRLDAHGRPLVYRPGSGGGGLEGSGGYVGAARGGQYGDVPGAEYLTGNSTTTTAGASLPGGVTGTGWSEGAADYSGSGYGAGWESLPRHHHPTRLSDVLEEDERSRTSPSRASMNSRR